MTGVSKFFAAESTTKYKGYDDKPLQDDEAFRASVSKVFDNVEKLLNKELDDVREDVKKQIVVYLDNNDFRSAEKFMKRLTRERSPYLVMIVSRFDDLLNGVCTRRFRRHFRSPSMDDAEAQIGAEMKKICRRAYMLRNHNTRCQLCQNT